MFHLYCIVLYFRLFFNTCIMTIQRERRYRSNFVFAEICSRLLQNCNLLLLLPSFSPIVNPRCQLVKKSTTNRIKWSLGCAGELATDRASVGPAKTRLDPDAGSVYVLPPVCPDRSAVSHWH